MKYYVDVDDIDKIYFITDENVANEFTKYSHDHIVDIPPELASEYQSAFAAFALAYSKLHAYLEKLIPQNEG